jgi:hypothetical protein
VTFLICVEHHASSLRRFFLIALMLLLGVAAHEPASAQTASCANSGLPGTPYEGYGAGTTGGAGKPVYRVTNLNDSGPGSLRDALSAGNRCVVFDVAGDIYLQKQIYTTGAYVTIDGFTAPSPGVTVRDYGISIWGERGAHDVILRGLRFRNPGQKSCTAGGTCYDGIQIKHSYRIVIDHVSVDRAADGAIDVAGDPGNLAHDITIQWSIMSGTRNTSLIGQHAMRVSQYRNLFFGGQNRNPQTQWDSSLSTQPPDTVLDLRNNVIWDFRDYGTLIRRNSTANVIENYFHQSSYLAPSAARALWVDYGGRAYANGNRSHEGVAIDGQGRQGSPFAAPSVTTTDVCVALYQVIAGAGARGPRFDLDALDADRVGDLEATGFPQCPEPTTLPEPTPSSPAPGLADLVMTSLSMPGTVRRGQGFNVGFTVNNTGSVAAGESRVRIYLSADTAVSSGDLLMRSRYITPIAAGGSQRHGMTEDVPTTVKAGWYYFLVVVDADRQVAESNEGNNVITLRVYVQ